MYNNKYMADKGRPSIYSEEILNKANQYFESLPIDEVVHSIEGLADYLEIHRDTIYDWCSQESKQDFSYIVNRILMRQGKTLINKTLKKEFEPRTSGMMLSKHGYATKTETDLTTNGKDLVDAISSEEKVKLLSLLNDKTSTRENN